MKPNFDKLIEELTEDMDQTGNVDMYALFKYIDGKLILTNYLYIIAESPTVYQEFTENTIAMILKSETILKILEIQRDMFR